MTFMLPETEDRSLEDIELHFSDNKRSIFSTHIQKSASNDTKLNGKPKDLQQTNEVESIGWPIGLETKILKMFPDDLRFYLLVLYD